MPRHHRKKPIDVGSAIVLLTLIVLNVAIWQNIFADRAAANDVARIYFLPVTQGESALLVLPHGVTIITDAGSDSTVVDDLPKAMPPGAGAYIDLAIISYPQTADYEGYQYLLEHYQVGAFIYNGRSDIGYSTEWKMLVATIAAKHIPLITVGAGDSIHYGSVAAIDILSPDEAFARSAVPNDTGIVQRVITPKFTVLLAADIGTNVEDALLAERTSTKGAGATLQANILKAPFPGLGADAGNPFLKAVAPRTIVVMPGAKASPSAPTKAMLGRLASSTSAKIVFPSDGNFCCIISRHDTAHQECPDSRRCTAIAPRPVRCVYKRQ